MCSDRAPAESDERAAIRLGDALTRRARLRTSRILAALGVLTAWLALSGVALAHGVADSDKAYLEQTSGPLPIPFAYLGAKHMVTGYDHLLFLVGVVFYLYRLKDVATYVTLFAIGHSITLIAGVLFELGMNAYVIDAIIGLSVVYKALDNLDVFQDRLGVRPNPKAATLIFGLFHGLGLATKILEFEISPDGLLTNLVSFNVGVEVGQLLALTGVLIAMGFWRRSASFVTYARAANLALVLAGMVLFGAKMYGFATDEG